MVPKWTRDPKSLAAGKILGNSSHEPVLYLVNLVPGQYIFNLKIWDDQVSQKFLFHLNYIHMAIAHNFKSLFVKLTVEI